MMIHQKVARCLLLCLILRDYYQNGDNSQTGVALAFVSPTSKSSFEARRSNILEIINDDLLLQSRESSIRVTTALRMATKSGGDGVIDAVIEESNNATFTENDKDDEISGELTVPEQTTRRRKRDMVRGVVKRLASLSLEDYRWRSNVFKKNEADRKVEESIARMMGEDPSYVRPMDASENKLGPLGKAEKDAVAWLSSVIEEEGKRAEQIANSDGKLVRPMDGKGQGPLADIERKAVGFFNKIVDSEKERANTGTLRPKDLDESIRGPLGEAEASIVSALEEITTSEKLRAAQSKVRGGEVVRPIDVPGPLGEAERVVLEFVLAERQRAKDREMNDGKVVRPMVSSDISPMGKAERRAVEAVERLQEEEKERLRNILRALEEKRPMEVDRDSPLGATEAFAVGVFRGPKLLMKVVDRVKELLQSEKMDKNDEEILRLAASSSAETDDNNDDPENNEKNKKDL